VWTDAPACMCEHIFSSDEQVENEGTEELLSSSPQSTQQECQRASTAVAKVAVRIARLQTHL
jgi:hypothetical protein